MVYVAGVAGEDELVGVVFGGEGLGHVFVGYYPVVQVVAHVVGVVEVAVAYFHPETEGLAGRVRDEGRVESPGALRSFGVPGPLLVDVGAGVGEDAVVEVGVVPGHDEGAGASGAAAHGGAGVGVVGEADVGLGFDEGEDFCFDELGVAGGEGVVFEASLRALRVAAAVLDGDGDHDGDFVLGDEVVEDGEEEVVGAVGSDDEGGDGAGDVLFGDIDGDVAGVGCGVAGGDDEPGRVGGVGRAEGAGGAGDAGVELAVGGGHGDVDEGALRDAGVDDGFGRWGVGGAEDEITVGCCAHGERHFARDRGDNSVGELDGCWAHGWRCCAHGGCGRLGGGEGCGGEEREGEGRGAKAVHADSDEVLNERGWLAMVQANVYPRPPTNDDTEGICGVLSEAEGTGLRELARVAAAHAYAPYSRFRVGAALLLDDGTVVTGCNVENCSYRLTSCAEQGAIARAVAEFGPKIRVRAVAVANLNESASMPCGACRQTLTEFGGDAMVVLYPGEGGAAMETTLGELLPHAFRGEYIG